MKRSPLSIGFAIMIAARMIACGQGTFINLNFESPILPLIPDGNSTVPITNALPGWRGYLGPFQTDRVFYNTISIGAEAISLQGPGTLFTMLEGSYTVLLQPAYPSGSPVPAIAQTGTVPASAKSIRFYSLPGSSYPLGFLTFAGQQIPISVINNNPGYSIYGGDITAFANQSGELRFTGAGYLDNIVFSNQQVPESGVCSLFGLGALVLGWRWRKKATP